MPKKKFVFSLSICIVICINAKLQAQEHIPCYAQYGFFENMLSQREDSEGYWMIMKADTNVVVFVGKNQKTYKHFDKKTMQLIVEGDLGGRVYTDTYHRFGKWTEYYNTGKIKTIGHYYNNLPTGSWQFFYPNGQLKESYSITLIELESAHNTCRVGLYELFYENGQVKETGFYKVLTELTAIEVLDYETSEPFVVNKLMPVSKKYGIWEYFNNDGKIKSIEEYTPSEDPMKGYDRKF